MVHGHVNAVAWNFKRGMCEIYLELNLTLWDMPNKQQEFISTQKDSFS